MHGWTQIRPCSSIEQRTDTALRVRGGVERGTKVVPSSLQEKTTRTLRRRIAQCSPPSSYHLEDTLSLSATSLYVSKTQRLYSGERAISPIDSQDWTAPLDYLSAVATRIMRSTHSLPQPRLQPSLGSRPFEMHPQHSSSAHRSDRGRLQSGFEGHV